MISIISKNKNIVLVVLAVASLVAYTLVAVNMSRGDYAVKDLNKEIAKVQKSNNELQLRLSEVSSLEFVLEESEKLSYENIEDATYIQKPTHSPFASR